MTVDNSADIIDSRDVIARIEQLQALRTAGPVLGEAGRAFCGRRVTVGVMWAGRAVDKFREPRNAHHNCARCFAVSS